MATSDPNLPEWKRLSSMAYHLSNEQVKDAIWYFFGAMEARLETRQITSKDVCDALNAAIKSVNPAK